MQSGKALILGQLIKQTAPFKPRHIYEPVGVSRQLCHSYLTQFVEQGAVTRQGPFYIVKDTEELINELVNTKEPDTAAKLTQTRLLKEVHIYNDLINYYLVMKALDLPHHKEVQESMKKEIDASVETLRNARRYLNAGVKSYGRSRKLLQTEGAVALWNAWETVLEPLIDKDQFISEANGAIDEDRY